MLTLLTSILATALLAQPPDSIVVSGVVVDAAEKPLSDVDVVLWARFPQMERPPRWHGRRPTRMRIRPPDRPATVAGNRGRVGLSLPTNRAGQSPFKRSI